MPGSPTIKLAYALAGDLYYGSFSFCIDGEDTKVEFDQHTFPRMMSRLAQHLREQSEVTGVVLTRLELGQSEYTLDLDTVELLRKDPAAAISSMMHESRTVHIGRHRSASSPPNLLRAGHDTVAAAFGDEVYLAIDNQGRHECPGCGRWSPRRTHGTVCCDKLECQLALSGVTHGGRWFSAATQQLLDAHRPRYYLPRAWNPSGGWISYEDLNVLFRDYSKERDTCNQVNDHTG
jgi:hypothetical protein